MTDIATESLAARRARARTLRAVTWERCAGPAGALRAVDAVSAADAVGVLGAGAAGAPGAADADGGEPVELVALLPSTEAATVLLLCELAAELTS